MSAMASAWSGSFSADILKGDFDGTGTTKTDIASYGVSLAADYLDSFSLGGTLRTADIEFSAQAPTPSIELSQDERAFYAKKHFFLDSVNGKVSLDLSFQEIDGNASDPSLGSVETTGFALRYLHLSNKFYMDVHRSDSDYTLAEDIEQTDFAIGFQFFSPSNWLQFRHYDIAGTTQATTVDHQSTDILFKRWLTTEKLLGIDSFFVATIAGDRIFTHDPDSLTTWNVKEEQTDNTRVGVDWELANDSSLSFLVGKSEYRNITDQSTYENTIFYLGYKKNW